MKTEPPFDDSAACPCCQLEVRFVFAELANLTRVWPAKGSAKQVSNLKTYAHYAGVALAIDDPAVKAMMALVTPVTMAQTYGEIALLMPAIRKAVAHIEPMVEQHFENPPHSRIFG